MKGHDTLVVVEEVGFRAGFRQCIGRSERSGLVFAEVEDVEAEEEEAERRGNENKLQKKPNDSLHYCFLRRRTGSKQEKT